MKSRVFANCVGVTNPSNFAKKLYIVRDTLQICCRFLPLMKQNKDASIGSNFTLHGFCSNHGCKCFQQFLFICIDALLTIG